MSQQPQLEITGAQKESDAVPQASANPDYSFSADQQSHGANSNVVPSNPVSPVTSSFCSNRKRTFGNLKSGNSPCYEDATVLPSLKSTAVVQAENDTKAFYYFILIWQMAFSISNGAVSVLIKAVNLLLGSFARKLFAEIKKKMPSSYYTLAKVMGISDLTKSDLCCCPECGTVYSMRKLRQDYAASRAHTQCLTKLFSKGTIAIGTCGAVLTSFRQGALRAKKRIAHEPIRNSLSRIMRSPGFLKSSNAWKVRESVQGYYFDVYDGAVWKQWHSQLTKSDTFYGLMANIDWFQPFDRRELSIGVLYFVILNLPAEIRYKKENIIISMIIPSEMADGDGKAVRKFQNMMQPVTDELLDLWKGLDLLDENNKSRKVRCALMGISSDIPATRKICGFAAHNATYGCSKCTIKLIHDAWCAMGQNRTRKKHLNVQNELLAAPSYNVYKNIIKQNGYKECKLLNLPYFSPATDHVIDPMHCLFTGIAKRVFEFWVKSKKITSGTFSEIDKRIRGFSTVPEMGRLPTKMESNWAGLKAEQWMNWTIYYSLQCLQGLIPKRQLICWAKFVKGCQILVQSGVGELELKKAQFLLRAFVESCPRDLEDGVATGNFHFCLHITDCIRTYGSIFTIWCFPFERYNKILSALPSNNHDDLEEQLLQKFINFSKIVSSYRHFRRSTNHSKINKLTDSLLTDGKSLKSGAPYGTFLASKTKLTQDYQKTWSNLQGISTHFPSLKSLSDAETDDLERIYRFLYPAALTKPISSSVWVYQFVLIGGEKFVSARSRRLHNSHVVAQWADETGINVFGEAYNPGVIRKLFSHKLQTMDADGFVVESRHIFAIVDWFKPCLDLQQSTEGSCDCYVWYPYNIIRNESRIIPVQRLFGKFIHLEKRSSANFVVWQIIPVQNKHVVLG